MIAVDDVHVVLKGHVVVPVDGVVDAGHDTPPLLLGREALDEHVGPVRE